MQFLLYTCCAVLIGVGYYQHSLMLWNIGVFTACSAFTNWIAIEMLFKRIPFLYGSGIFLTQFKAIQASLGELFLKACFQSSGIRELKAAVANLLQEAQWPESMQLLDFESIWGSLLAAIKPKIPLLFLGDAVLENIKEMVIASLKTSWHDFLQSERLKKQCSELLMASLGDAQLQQRLAVIVQAELGRLQPEMLRDLLLTAMRKHLDALILWGGLLGGMMGALSALWHP